MMQKEIVWAGLNGELDLQEMYFLNMDNELEDDNYFSYYFVLSIIDKVIDQKMDLKYFKSWIELINKCLKEQYNEVHKELIRIVEWGLRHFKIEEYDKEKLEKVKGYFIHFAGVFSNSLILNSPCKYKNMNVYVTYDRDGYGGYESIENYLVLFHDYSNRTSKRYNIIKVNENLLKELKGFQFLSECDFGDIKSWIKKDSKRDMGLVIDGFEWCEIVNDSLKEELYEANDDLPF